MQRRSVVHAGATLERLAWEDGPPGETAILEAFRDESTSVREHAIALAARYLEPETLIVLVGNQDDALQRNAAISALQRQGPYAVPRLVDIVRRADDPELLMFAVQILGEIRAASAASAIVPLLRHDDLNVSQAAAVALGNMRASAAVPDLVALLDEDLWLQVAAIVALGQIGHPRSVEPLLGCLENEMLMEVTIEALGKIGSPDALSHLVRLTTSEEHHSLRSQIVVAIGWILDRHPDPGPDFAEIRHTISSGGGGSLERFLHEVLQHGERHLWHAAGFLAVAAGFDRLYPLILRVLFEGGDDARTLRLLCRADHGFRSICEHGLVERDVIIRRAAISALSPSLSVQRLLVLLRDDDVDVRVAVCCALGRRRSVAAIPALVRSLVCRDDAEQVAAKRALAMMPGGALGALETLLGRDTPELTIELLRILEASRSRLFRQWVLEKLGSGRRDIRICALRVLSNHSGEDVDAAIRACRTDPDEDVRAEVIDCLVRRNPEGLAIELIGQLGIADAVRYNAIRGLGRLRWAEAAEPLRALFAEASPLEQTAIVEALVQIEPPWCVSFLHDLLGRYDEPIRQVAARGLAHVADRHDLSMLVELAGDADWYIRNHAVVAMRRLRMIETRETLLTLARDLEPIVAAAARAGIEEIDEQAGA